MSAKRSAPFSVDEKTLEVTENNQDASKQHSEENGAPAPRTILKVKKDEEAPKQAETKEEPKKMLFSGLFNNSNNGVGLFNNSNIFSTISSTFNPSKIDLTSKNLFTGNGIKPTLNIFKNDTAKEGEEKNIFGFGAGNNLPPVRAGEEDEEGDSAELEERQNLPIDKSKSSGTYKYESQLKNLFLGHAKKYKRNNGDLIESVEVVVEVNEKSKAAVLVVRLPATKHPIFSGLLLPTTVSELRLINNKQENIEVVAVSVEEGKKPVKEHLKLQFDDAATGKRFQDAVTTFANDKAQGEGEKEQTVEKKEDSVEKKE